MKHWKVFARILGAAILLYFAAPWLIVHFGGSDELVEAQLSPIQLACGVGASPISSLITRNQTTGALLYNACVDINGNLFLNPASVPGKLGPQTFNVVSGGSSTIATSRKILGVYNYTNPNTTGTHVLSVVSGTGFLASDLGTTLDCYNTGSAAQAVNESTITAFTSSISITFTGFASGTGGGQGTVCVVGGLDATAAILAAENALAATGNAGLVYIPCGGYLVNAPLSTVTLPAGTLIQGDGSQCTTFYLPGDFAWSTTVGQLFITSSTQYVGQMAFDALGQTTAVAIKAIWQIGGVGFDLFAQNLTAASANQACILASTDNSSNLYMMRVAAALCSNVSVNLTAHGASLINPQINGNFSTAEPDISIIGGYVNGTVSITSQNSFPTAIVISGTRITSLNLSSHGGALVSGSDIGPCTQGQGCSGSEVGTGITIDSTSNLEIANSFVSGGGSGKFAISNAGVFISGGGNNLLATNSAVIYGGGGTFRRSPGEICCTALVTGSFALAGNWGTSPSVSLVNGFDSAFTLSITSGTGAPGANPSVSLTFLDGSWGGNGPSCNATRADSQAPLTATWIAQTSSTLLSLFFIGTPGVSTPYKVSVVCAPNA